MAPHGTPLRFSDGCRCDWCCNERDKRVLAYLVPRGKLNLFVEGKDWPVNA